MAVTDVVETRVVAAETNAGFVAIVNDPESDKTKAVNRSFIYGQTGMIEECTLDNTSSKVSNDLLAHRLPISTLLMREDRDSRSAKKDLR